MRCYGWGRSEGIGIGICRSGIGGEKSQRQGEIVRIDIKGVRLACFQEATQERLMPEEKLVCSCKKAP